METGSAKSSRKPRADALRNRERVLEAAKAVFSAGGPDASLEAVAREAGEVRADITPEDLLRTLVGMCMLHDQPGWQASVIRMLDVLVDGLRAQSDAGKPVPRRSPKP
jgi:hypothetical protein